MLAKNYKEFMVGWTSDFLDVAGRVSELIYVPDVEILGELLTARKSETNRSHFGEKPNWESVKLRVTMDSQVILFYTTTVYGRRIDVRLDFDVKNGVIKYFGRKERWPAGSDARWK